MKTAEDVLNEKPSRMITVPPDTPVIEVVEKLVKNRIGAMLISDDEKILGIWTERNLMDNLLQPGFDPTVARVGDYMQTALISVTAETPILRLQEMFLGLFIRHILIKKGQKELGLLSIGDVLRSILLEKDREIRKLDEIANWEYYENWGWHLKR
ncbi:MAG: CBS domain-containing protein [Thermodesulfobacteriota bacterium]|nr:CBS domain-containing protein [Thermodesulfobacteriota bacterium]